MGNDVVVVVVREFIVYVWGCVYVGGVDWEGFFWVLWCFFGGGISVFVLIFFGLFLRCGEVDFYFGGFGVVLVELGSMCGGLWLLGLLEWWVLGVLECLCCGLVGRMFERKRGGG